MIYEQAAMADIQDLVQFRYCYIASEDVVLSQEEEQKLARDLPVYYQEHLGKDLIAFVARDGGEIAATVFLHIITRPARPEYIHGKFGEVLNVFTKPEYRHQGIAEQLLRELLAYAREAELDFVELEAVGGANTLYEKVGFAETVSPYTSMKLNL